MIRDSIVRALVKAAKSHKVRPSAILALVEVETAGNPFEADGHTPNFLFERHVFYRELGKISAALRSKAVRMGLAHPSWQPKTQYKDERTSGQRMILLGKAMSVNEEAAKASASWGLGQIMGNEYPEVQLSSACELFTFSSGNVDNQIELIFRLLKSKGIIDAMNAKNWARVALRWNGPGYRKNAYDTKLAAADRRWEAKISQILKREVPPEQELSVEEIKSIQRLLISKGYKTVGYADGKWGTKTTGAISAFQTHEGLPLTGHYDEATKAALRDADPIEVSKGRQEATLDDLREEGSTTVAAADGIDKVATGKMAVAAAGGGYAGAEKLGLLDHLDQTQEKVQHVKTIWDGFSDVWHSFSDALNLPQIGHFLLQFWWAFLLASALGLFFYSKKIKKARLTDHQTGVHEGVEDKYEGEG